MNFLEKHIHKVEFVFHCECCDCALQDSDEHDTICNACLEEEQADAKSEYFDKFLKD